MPFLPADSRLFAPLPLPSAAFTHRDVLAAPQHLPLLPPSLPPWQPPPHLAGGLPAPAGAAAAAAEWARNYMAAAASLARLGLGHSDSNGRALERQQDGTCQHDQQRQGMRSQGSSASGAGRIEQAASGGKLQAPDCSRNLWIGNVSRLGVPAALKLASASACSRHKTACTALLPKRDQLPSRQPLLISHPSPLPPR